MQGNPASGPSRAAASEAVSTPAILLMVTGGLGVLMALYGIVQRVTGMDRRSLEAFNANPDLEKYRPLVEKLQSTGSFTNVIVLITSALVIYGALQMRSLKSWGLALTASILALIPCLGPCCCIGIPVGIWSLVVLNKPEVKGAFEDTSTGGAPPGAP
jgi:hypothetical protein